MLIFTNVGQETGAAESVPANSFTGAETRMPSEEPRVMFVEINLKRYLEMAHAGANQPKGISDTEVGCPK